MCDMRCDRWKGDSIAFVLYTTRLMRVNEIGFDEQDRKRYSKNVQRWANKENVEQEHA